jgi:hypothetical protein
VGFITPIVLNNTFHVDWTVQIRIVLAALVLVAGTIAYFKGALTGKIVVGAVGIWVGLLGLYLIEKLQL